MGKNMKIIAGKFGGIFEKINNATIQKNLPNWELIITFAEILCDGYKRVNNN